MVVYHVCINVLLIHSSVTRCQSCHHVLSAVNNAAINVGYRYLFKTLLSALLSVYPEVDLLDHR